MTIGWVREDALERFFEGTEPQWPPLAISQLRCPFCAVGAANTKALYAHFYEKHTARRPSLLIAGREPASVDEIRRPISGEGILIFDAETIEQSIDGSPFARADAGAISSALSERGHRRVVLQLSNRAGGAGALNQRRYDLTVYLPTNAELESVDRTFVRLFGEQLPHIGAIAELSASAEGTAAETYAAGLAEYVRGVLGKDRDPRSGVHGAPVDWLDAYKRALAVLKEVQRPLPKLLSAIIRFALNDYSRWREPSGFGNLDHCARILGGIATGQDMKFELPPSPPDLMRGVCPIDAGLSRVIQLAARYSILDRWSAIDRDDATLLSNMEQLGGLDRAKVRALWAWTTLRLGAEREADEPLRAIEGHDCFGEWARSHLEAVNQ